MPDCEGNVEKLCMSEGESHDGSVLRLSCCPRPAAQEQELVRQWKQTRRDLFSTAPLPFGLASFSTGGAFEIAGPPKPGDNPRLAGARVVIEPPSGPTSPPVSAPIPPTGSSD